VRHWLFTGALAAALILASACASDTPEPAVVPPAAKSTPSSTPTTPDVEWGPVSFHGPEALRTPADRALRSCRRMPGPTSGEFTLKLTMTVESGKLAQVTPTNKTDATADLMQCLGYRLRPQRMGDVSGPTEIELVVKRGPPHYRAP